MLIVVDTSVFVSALLSESGASREVIRRCLQGRHTACMSLALFSEYRDLLGRETVFANCPLSKTECMELFHALIATCRMTEIYYLWRPNLIDEADNHVMELAVAARAEIIVTHNLADFKQTQLKFPAIRILSPANFLMEDR